MAKPGRQLITFLLFANITLWILDTFMTHNWITQDLQLKFYGLLAWGIISRISLPLLIFYRYTFFKQEQTSVCSTTCGVDLQKNAKEWLSFKDFQSL